MYNVDVVVKGIAPLMQNRFMLKNDDETESKGATRRTGAKDYSYEWRDHLYADKEMNIYQPASHFEGAMVNAAVNFKVTGKRGKSYKDLFKAAIFVVPDRIPHGMKVPEELTTDADQPLYQDIRPVVIKMNRVAKSRPCFAPGWELAFEIRCTDDEIHPDLLQDVLTLAGKNVGIGDYRPRFGRFNVIKFEVHKQAN